MTSTMPNKQAPMDGQHDDPFVSFNQAAGAGRVRDPYPQLAELRSRSPLYEGSLDDVFGGLQLPSVVGDPGAQQFTVLGYDLASKVILDTATYSSRIYANTLGRVMGHTIIEMDEPEHRTHRGLLQQAFSPKAMERWEREIVVPIMNELIDAFPPRGPVDLIRQLAFPLPIQVIAIMLGLPAEDLPEFHRRAVELVSIAFNPERGFMASIQLHEYFGELVVQRRKDPRDDMISVLAQASLNGQQLSDEDVITFLRLLLPAGAETTYRSLSNLLFALLKHPDQLAAVRRDRSLVRVAVEEALRWETPVMAIGRVTTRETELLGKSIPAGSVVHICLGAANRDPARWAHPEKFDISREAKSHLSFASGPHTCLGLHLARMEMRVALESLLDRIPEMRLDPEAKDVHITGLSLRSPITLPALRT
jgi:cytochrome P450